MVTIEAGRLTSGLTVIAACALLAACSADDSPGARSTTAVAASNSSSATQSPAVPITSELPGAAVFNPVAVGEVPGNPNAAKALQPWVSDLVNGDVNVLIRKCWTIEPNNARNEYSDRDGILAAVVLPGKDGQFAVAWTGPTESVHVKRSELASGYACPRVDPTGTPGNFNEADARYAVHRYLSRWVGKPVNADDTEGKYPLVCSGSVLANNPGSLTGTTSFDESKMTYRPTPQPTSRDRVEVSVPVTNSSSVTQTRVFGLTVGSEGYCIDDINP